MGKRKRYSKQKLEKEDIKKKQDADVEEDEADDEGEETEEPKPRRGKRTNVSDDEVADDKQHANSEESESEEEEVPRKNETTVEDKNTDEGENDTEYEVESIVDDRKVKGKTQYRVRWKGFSSVQDTWENEENLDCENLLNEYLSSKGQSSNDENTEKRKNNKDNKKGKKRAKGIKSNAHGNKKPRADVKPDENGEFEISRIIDMHVAKNGKHEYLVLWKGFPFSESSWEPEEHVKETAAYDRFLKKLEEAKSISVKELRVSRRPTDRFTMTSHDKGRRLSRRFENKQRAKYFEAE